MFLSTYIPVDMHRVNCAVYSAEKVFPKNRLLLAHEFLTGGKCENAYMEENMVMFTDSDDRWTIYEVYLAYEAYSQALKSKFSFYTTRNEQNIPQLFISKAFRSHRLIVNAFTMQTLLLGNSKLVNKAASLIDKTVSVVEACELFDSMAAIESGTSQFLPALLAYRNTPDEYMAVSPIMTPNAEVGTIYGSDLIEEIKMIVSGILDKTESFALDEDGYIYRHDMNCSYYLSFELAEYLISIYDKTKAKKSNYLEIRDQDYEVKMFYSTNGEYLVNARTFECLVIRNQNMKALLNKLVKVNNIPREKLQMIWSLAKTE